MGFYKRLKNWTKRKLKKIGIRRKSSFKYKAINNSARLTKENPIFKKKTKLTRVNHYNISECINELNYSKKKLLIDEIVLIIDKIQYNNNMKYNDLNTIITDFYKYIDDDLKLSNKFKMCITQLFEDNIPFFTTGIHSYLDKILNDTVKHQDITIVINAFQIIMKQLNPSVYIKLHNTKISKKQKRLQLPLSILDVKSITDIEYINSVPCLGNSTLNDQIVSDIKNIINMINDYLYNENRDIHVFSEIYTNIMKQFFQSLFNFNSTSTNNTLSTANNYNQFYIQNSPYSKYKTIDNTCFNKIFSKNIIIFDINNKYGDYIDHEKLNLLLENTFSMSTDRKMFFDKIMINLKIIFEKILEDMIQYENKTQKHKTRHRKYKYNPLTKTFTANTNINALLGNLRPFPKSSIRTIKASTSMMRSV